MDNRRISSCVAVLILMSTTSVFGQAIGEKKNDVATPPMVEKETPPVVMSDADLIIERVPLNHTDSGEIAQVISKMLGGALLVNRNGQVGRFENIVASGNAVLLFDTPERVQRLKKTVEMLDVKPTERPEPRPTIVVEEFSPRYVTLGDCSSALKIYTRSITTYEFRTQVSVPNVTFVQDRGTIILRDTEQNVAEMSRLLKSLDAPKAQVLITCTVVEAVEPSKNDSNLPQDLVKDLAELTGRSSFRTVTTGMVRTAVRSDRPVEINMNGAENVEAKLTLKAAAYDEKTEVLTLDALNFSLLTPLPSGGRTQQSFSTSTVLPSKSFTVIGAAGSQTMFVVLRMVTVK